MPKRGWKAYQPTKALLVLKTKTENEKKLCTLDSTWRSLPLQQHKQRLQRTSNQAPKRKQHSAAPWSGTLQRHPCSCKATQLHNSHSTLTAALQHPAAAPCNGTSNPAPKRKVRAHSVVCDDCSKVRSHTSMYLENVTVIIVDLVEYAPRQVCGIRFLHLLNAPATLFSQEHQEE